MKTLATISLALLTALAFSSCYNGGGGAPWRSCGGCGAYNADYLRDVPTSRSERF